MAEAKKDKLKKNKRTVAGTGGQKGKEEVDIKEEVEPPKIDLLDANGMFEKISRLGKGQYGIVDKCKNLKTGEIIALKRLPRQDVDLWGLKKEKDATEEAIHQNILRYINYYGNEKEIMIEMEFAEQGSILDLMTRLGICLLEDEVAEVTRQTLEGLAFLHSKHKIHRDIKCANLMLNNSGIIKIGDFGVSKQVDQNQLNNQTKIGSPCWMAPEMLEEEGGIYNELVDIWSLGITAIEMAEGKAPYSELSPFTVLVNITKNSPASLAEPDEFSREFSDFISACLTKDPKQRPSAKELLKHPFVQKSSGPQMLIDMLHVSEEEGVEEEAGPVEHPTKPISNEVPKKNELTSTPPISIPGASSQPPPPVSVPLEAPTSAVMAENDDWQSQEKKLQDLKEVVFPHLSDIENRVSVLMESVIMEEAKDPVAINKKLRLLKNLLFEEAL